MIVFGLVVPEYRIDIKVDQPGGRLSLLTNLLLVAVGNYRYLVASCTGPILVTYPIIKNRIDPGFFSSGINDSFREKQGFKFWKGRDPPICPSIVIS